MLSINPYLHFKGNAEEAMKFYNTILGGEITALHRYNEIPGSEKMPKASQEKLIHSALTIANGYTIMASDRLESMDSNIASGNNFHICVHTKSETESDKVFNALSAGGTIEMPLNKTFFGSYFGMCRDKFGINWMINYTYNQQ